MNASGPSTGTRSRPRRSRRFALRPNPRVKSAIKDNLTIRQKLFGNQDDVLGFAHVAFIDDEIARKDFEFPQIADKSQTNRFVLSGRLTVGPVPPDPVDRCAAQRAAVQAQRDEIRGLHTRKTVLQQQLQTAAPQAKRPSSGRSRRFLQ